MNCVIEYSGFLAMLEGYNDAKWIFESDETKSTSGSAVTWRSVKQTVIDKSIMESEFVALEMAGSEVE